MQLFSLNLIISYTFIKENSSFVPFLLKKEVNLHTIKQTDLRCLALSSTAKDTVVASTEGFRSGASGKDHCFANAGDISI